MRVGGTENSRVGLLRRPVNRCHGLKRLMRRKEKVPRRGKKRKRNCPRTKKIQQGGEQKRSTQRTQEREIHPRTLSDKRHEGKGKKSLHKQLGGEHESDRDAGIALAVKTKNACKINGEELVKRPRDDSAGTNEYLAK